MVLLNNINYDEYNMNVPTIIVAIPPIACVVIFSFKKRIPNNAFITKRAPSTIGAI